MTSVAGTVRIVFDSDWHCGTGHGRHGGVDRVIARDADGLPFVPAKTLRGLWRDACEKAGLGLDDGAPGEWTRLVHRIFGAPTGGADNPDLAAGGLRLRPARLPVAWQNGLAEPAVGDVPSLPAMFRRELVVQHYGVKIERATGVADDDTLRLIERARAGLTVEAPFSVDVATVDWAVDLLLQAGAALWHHVGSSRRRGAGRCRVSITGRPTVTDLLAEHRAQIPSFTLAEPPAAPTVKPPTAGSAETIAAAPPRAAILTITATLPIICGRSVQGNVAKGHDFIPAATVLPMVARALGSRSAALIRDGLIQVSDATPMIGKRRSVPSPRALHSGDKGRAWRRDDGAAGKVFDGLNGTEDGKPVGGWAVIDTDTWRIGRVSLTTSAHANIDDATQRPTENGLYTFEAIPAGTRLQCLLAASAEAVTENEWAQLLALNGSDQSFGRYRTGDFGQARVEVADAAVPGDPTSGMVDQFEVWLTSDAHLIDDLGLPDPTAGRLASELSARLNSALRVDNALVSVARRDSWTTTGALPRASRVCLAAGSVVRLSVEGGVTIGQLADALAEGVGEGRVEGFGQLRLLNDFPTAALPESVDTAGTESRDRSAEDALDTDSDWSGFVRLAWQQEIGRQVCLLAAVAPIRLAIVGKSPSKAQRGTLREAARMLIRDNQSVARWLDATHSDGGKSDAWGKDALHLLATMAHPKDGRKAWAARLAGQLNAWGTKEGLLPIPDNLAGLDPAPVAAAMISECLAQQGRQPSPGGTR